MVKSIWFITSVSFKLKKHTGSSAKMKTLSASKMKLERAYTSSLTPQLKALEQKEANTPKRSRLQETNSGLKSTKQKQKELYKEVTKLGAVSLRKLTR